jgi:GTP-binding protein
MTVTIAIAGRPNVGKSTLFNRLVGKSMAIVSDVSGVTRDWREGDGELFDLSFRVLDTAGLEDVRTKGSLAARTAAQTKAALAQTDVILFMVDGRAGLMDDDKAIAREIRKTGLPILLLVNKCEGTYLPANFDDFASLGFGDAIAVSSSHGEGLMDLHAAIKEHFPEAVTDDVEAPTMSARKRRFSARRQEKKAAATAAALGEPPVEDEGDKTLHIAVVGRPNAGKSTLINRLIGEERMLTGPEPGLTRDAIPIGWEFNGQPVRLVDTAGLRRKARITEALEKMSAHESLRAIRLAHVVVLVIDANQPFDKQDLIIAHHVAEEGRALVVAVNKWDTVKEKHAVMSLIEKKAEVSLAQVAGLPIVPISALKGDGLEALMKGVMRVYQTWNIRVSTGKLNRWLQRMEDDHPPPIVSGRRVKLRYMTQIKSRPPTFQLWVNKPVDLPESYTRFLTNGLRSTFNLEGVPIRWQLKKGDNPYENKRKKS